jgi:hypothetical protein
MPYVLRDSLRSCIVSESAVFLDLETGRYSALAGSHVPAFERWASGAALSLADHCTLHRLAELGVFIIAPIEGKGSLAGPSMVPPRAAVDTRGHAAGIGLLAAAFALRLLWSWRVRHWSLNRLISHIGRLGDDDRSADAALPGKVALLKRTVRSFEVVDIILGSHDQCLARSLALTAACRQRNLESTFIIGVRPAPFAAHSWVQQDGFILNETPDRAMLFTPILAA